MFKEPLIPKQASWDVSNTIFFQMAVDKIYKVTWIYE